MSEAIKVKRIKVEGKSYLYDERTNIVYDEESKEAIGVLSKDKKSIDFYDDDEDEELRPFYADDFEDEEEYKQIEHFDLKVTLEPDEYNSYTIYQNGFIVSETDPDKDTDEGIFNFEDITDIFYPFQYEIKHKEDILPVYADFLVGYTPTKIVKKGQNPKISYPILWNGKIRVGDDFEDLTNDIGNIKKPVGLLVAFTYKETGEDIELEYEENVKFVMKAVNSKNPDVIFKHLDVPKLINKYFIQPLSKNKTIEPSSLEKLPDLDELPEIKPLPEDELLKLEKQIKDLLGVMRDLQNQSKINTDVNVKKDLAKRFKETKEQVDKLKEQYLTLLEKGRPQNQGMRGVPAEEKELTGKGIEPKDTKLYEKAKQIADEKYKKPSAYKSGFIVKKYKELGGTYSGKKPQKTGIARWFKEEWKDVGNAEYPVYRPTKRITIETPLTPDEIKPSNLKKQIKLKQQIKGEKNLPPFLPLGKVEPNERMKRVEVSGGKVVAIGVQAEKIPKADEIWKWSNPDKVAEMAKKYLGDMAVVFRSTKPKKKYMIFDPNNNKWVFFGEMGYEDFTKHQDEKRRENYLTRTAKMKGNWKDNRYSANNLSRNILW